MYLSKVQVARVVSCACLYIYTSILNIFDGFKQQLILPLSYHWWILTIRQISQCSNLTLYC